MLELDPRLILADQPTRGLDVGAVAFVHGRLLDARRRGAGIVLISEDLDELLRLSDRVAVMHRGRLSETMPTAGRHRPRARPADDRAGAACGLSRAPTRRRWLAAGAPVAAVASALALAALPLAVAGADLAGAYRQMAVASFGSLVRAQRDPDPGDAADPDRPRRRRGLPRPALEHRRRGPALPGRGGRRGAGLGRGAGAGRPCCCRCSWRRAPPPAPSSCSGRPAQAPARRRRGGDHAAAQLRGAAAGRHAARGADAGPDEPGLAAVGAGARRGHAAAPGRPDPGPCRPARGAGRGRPGLALPRAHRLGLRDPGGRQQRPCRRLSPACRSAACCCARG